MKPPRRAQAGSLRYGRKMKLGLEILFDSHLETLKGKRIGLVVNPTSVDHSFAHAADTFADYKEFQLTTLFGPQHGIRGQTQDNMIEWEGFRDPRTGIPVYSLYGATRVPTPEMLEHVDVLVFDMQDVGTRIYTFIYTIAYCMQACARDGKQMVVLDRPNPISGSMIEGNVLEEEFASFVGLYPIPTRHGMTMGELAQLFNQSFRINCDLTIIRMDGWQRNDWFDDTDAPWVIPSPNMPTLDTATVFPGMVHFEGTMVSEGRGTTRPFELLGAPYIDPESLVKELTQELRDGLLPGVHFRPHFFQPTFQKHAGQLCGGLQIHVLDRNTFKPVLTGIAVLKSIHKLYSNSLKWKEPPYEYVYDKNPFDVIAGTDKLRKQIESGTSLAEIEASWRPGLEEFATLRSNYLLY